ncbi:hypothetical protein CCR75_009620 [Bremia lactucae]|uniref:Zinc finger PHD-type domain-containing protein n=1 Tax=Bremia lactucae TaxID=4779 RepID=A0A976FN92_BRELC|nr:hypothetical protein CCR75_009620 [Bremia lactucae]
MADSAPASLACPVCFECFSSINTAAFALHVSSCSSSSTSRPDSPSSPSAYCPRCLHVYAAGTPAHEISFHEHECARVNEQSDDNIDDELSSTACNRTNKRPRYEAVARTSSTPRVTLFPTVCFLCGNGGRGLFHCAGICARVAHQNCVEHLQAPAVGEPLSVTERKQAAENWKCAQCLRNLHRCQHCGFLGHQANGMRKCTVLNCGYHFHEQCLPAIEADETVDASFVCPRHTCAACGMQEIDMKRCRSCTLCYHMTHLRCPRGSGTVTTGSINYGGLDPINLVECSSHEINKISSCSPDASNSFRQRLAAGDIVLVLEFNNALLPSSTKVAAPGAANHWGAVISVEETESLGRGNQLLSLRMFADDSVVVVPNQYALRVATASDFGKPVDLMCYCLQRHAMVELQLRRMVGVFDEAEEKRIVKVSVAAFAARLDALGMTLNQATRDAEQGLVRWRRFQELPQPREYDGLGDLAPSFLYLDTRGHHFGLQRSTSMEFTEAVSVEAGRDVNITNLDPDSGPASDQSRDSWIATASSQPTDFEKRSNGTGSIVESRTKYEMTTNALDLPHDGGSWSQTAPAGSRDSSPNSTAWPKFAFDQAIGINMRGSKRMEHIHKSANTKYRMLNTEASADFKAIATTPIGFRGLNLEEPFSRKTASVTRATLHISPMTSRTILPQKRRKLTRKQKLLDDMPQILLAELERDTFCYLGDVDELKLKRVRVPADADAFPWAARAASFRPAFYRPTVMFGLRGHRHPRIDDINRLLVSQDKRSIKCFVQAFGTDTQCVHFGDLKLSSVFPYYVVDLMTVRNFRDLDFIVRSRLVEVLEKHSRYTREHFGMDELQVQRWLEQHRRRKTSEQPPITLHYCLIDGARRRLELEQSFAKVSYKSKQAWLCFCANVCHLSVSIPISHQTLSGLTR